ncbi:helix-turn-helix transcriptional regulator [Lysinibacillus fusiformis]|uniref:helix-turn-helix domain-containing protein n=1 Tax=Lysinibacillus fusiformis TaxID=28031 RepID=UPI001E48D466|nr:helix-turn-helix transcriptional regulator [Lysinibacillus fusiformis]MCE4044585.1 helix-turn-helix transcriptional regulator [Lysinibacillus fusiformis]
MTNTIGDRIKVLRNELGLSMAAFGEKIKMTNSNISKMEKDLRVVTDRTIAIICTEFNVNEEWLRTGDGDMFVEETFDEEFANIIAEATLSGNEKIKELMIMASKLNDKQLKAMVNFLETMVEEK